MTDGSALPLSSLRAHLDEGSACSRWLVDPDGVLGRVLELEAGAAYTVPLVLDGSVSLRSRAMLFPHDWRDLRGAVRVVVAMQDGGGSRRELWAGTLRAGDRGRPGGLAVDCELPPSTTGISLQVHPLRHPPERGLARAIWVDPVLNDPSAAEEPAGQPDQGHSSVLDEIPLFSVLVPVHDPPIEMLEEAVASVRSQTFESWELCLVDDGSVDPAVIAALDAHAATDARIRVARHPAARGISAATNTAVDLAGGAYIALLDHDDTLAPDALERIAQRIAAEPGLDMVYTDEDIVDGGRQVWVHLKPGWSPDTLRTNGYTCHLGVYRRSLVQEVGGFRSAFDGSQDIDLILRLTERTDRIAHVPAVLYHWRAHPASTAGGDAKPYAYVAARNAYAAHLQRTGLVGEVGYGPPGLYRLSAAVGERTRVAIVLAVADARGLAAAAGTWVAQPHREWEAVISAPSASVPDVREALAAAGMPGERLTILESHPSESPSAGALLRATDQAATRADQLLILQTAAAGLTHDWLSRLAGYAAQDGIAAAGPVLLSPDGRVQNAGVALPDGIALHLLHGTRTSMDDFFGYGTSVHNVSAVSGVLAMPAATFLELGGLDPTLGELALIDLCVRAGEMGLRIVTVPDVRMRATGPDPSGNDLPALRRLQTRWRLRHDGDPYYNAGYRTDRGDFARRGR